jgi:hypothetical protein
MKGLRSFVVAVCLVVLAFAGHAQNLCSTEKVNHDDCMVYVSRRYPVTLPTIQMKPGKKVIVVVKDPLEFETLTLDWTSGTALPGTDQGAALVTAVIPDLKGLFFSNVILPAPPAAAAEFAEPEGHVPAAKDPCSKDSFNPSDCWTKLATLYNDATDHFHKYTARLHLIENITTVYAQLNQVLSPIPKPGFDPNITKADYQYVAPYPASFTHDPWTDYAAWREMVLCELAGPRDDSVDPTKCATSVPFTNVLGDIAMIQGKLPSTTPPSTVTALQPGQEPPAPKQDPGQLFDQKYFDYEVKQATVAITALHHGVAPEDTPEGRELQNYQLEENLLTSRIAALSNTLTNVQKDFVTYYQNILQVKELLPDMQKHWNIYDPAIFQKGNTPVSSHRLLGRQVVYTVNAVNQISTPRASITATTAKVPIATVTVLFADPIFETSAGGIVSFVHNRSFVNQTVTTAQPGTLQVSGDIIISETKTDPEVEPFVAGHWRIGRDFTMPDLRRGAFYGSVWVGLNPYTSLPEYGAGPTLSWRSFMFSAVYNRAHEVELMAPQAVNEILCSPSAVAGATPPPCTPAPPAPVTQTIPINAFAIGISIRLPTTFTAGTGGVSH